MSKKEWPILTSIENGIQKVILNRPTKKNALTTDMYKELTNILNESSMNENIIALVLTGNGDFYSSGNDFLHFIQNPSFDIVSELNKLQKLIDAIILYPKLLIAIVNGPAIGIAATTLALFDIVYASETAYFMTPFSKLGLMAEGCSTYTFPRIMGPSKAGSMLYFGEKLTAKEAFEVGLVSKVYKKYAEDEIWIYLKTISSLSKESLAATKRLLKKWDQELLIEVNKQEMTELQKIFQNDGFSEIILKFLPKKSKM